MVAMSSKASNSRELARAGAFFTGVDRVFELGFGDEGDACTFSFTSSTAEVRFFENFRFPGHKMASLSLGSSSERAYRVRLSAGEGSRMEQGESGVAPSAQIERCREVCQDLVVVRSRSDGVGSLGGIEASGSVIWLRRR
ncbi:unnamed protein product [Microthlaspi erraticum]|uniref:Uncharacterized protein n=1 Tax=Microthlaspi erraticum TaxID=1685480 RepID=A0A6D2HRE3_9BRAS|nr:unnamed protein product [Microthlaspi erraticum]